MFLSQAISSGPPSTQRGVGSGSAIDDPGIPLRDGAATGVRCRIAPLLPDRSGLVSVSTSSGGPCITGQIVDKARGQGLNTEGSTCVRGHETPPIAPPLPDRVLVAGEGGEGIAFSRRGSSIKDMDEYYAWAMDIQVGFG